MRGSRPQAPPKCPHPRSAQLTRRADVHRGWPGDDRVASRVTQRGAIPPAPAPHFSKMGPFPAWPFPASTSGLAATYTVTSASTSLGMATPFSFPQDDAVSSHPSRRLARVRRPDPAGKAPLPLFQLQSHGGSRPGSSALPAQVRGCLVSENFWFKSHIDCLTRCREDFSDTN